MSTTRTELGQIAARHGLAILACGTHPFSEWRRQTLTPKARYEEVANALGTLSKRVHVCGLHIHVAMPGVNGSVVIFLCQTAANPDPTGLAPQCPQEGTVSGTITAANVVAGATATQQLKAGDLAAIITAIRAGAAYANVHTTLSPGGEIRGQIKLVSK